MRGRHSSPERGACVLELAVIDRDVQRGLCPVTREIGDNLDLAIRDVVDGAIGEDGIDPGRMGRPESVS